MHLLSPFIIFHNKQLFDRNKLLPHGTDNSKHPLTCAKCYFVNKSDYHFCTHCGYPIAPTEENVIEFNNRQQLKRDLVTTSKYKILLARNTLYVLAAFCMLGILHLSSSYKAVASKGFLMVFLGIIYAGLGKWSTKNPFTSMLISLIMTVTFVAINTWAQFSTGIVSAYAIVLLIIQVALVYILLQGVKGAFHADILEEEYKL